MEEIKIENLTFTYPKNDSPALSNVNLTFEKGKFYLICSKSGGGKTTLLRLIKSVGAPYGEKVGKIYFENADIETLSDKKCAQKIGFVYQNPDNQIVCDKVWHEISFGLESLSYPQNEIRMRVCEMASFFGMQSWFYEDVSHLSGGQKQLLNLASVMVMRPSVLILDEPTSMLDPIAAHDFIETVVRINKELGTTVIMTEHRLEEVFPIADGIVVLDDGKVFSSGSANSVGKSIYENKKDMISSLPTPMRVYYGCGNKGESPLTVCDGRNWLFEKCAETANIRSIPYECTESKKSRRTAMKINDVYFRYEKNSADVLKKTSLEICESEVFAIVGANAAGKSTLLSVMCGIYRPYRGSVKVFGKKKVVMIEQNVQSIFTEKTVLDELENAMGDDLKNNPEKIKNTSELFGLSNLLKKHPYDLSGGQQQKLAIAIAMLKKPEILLLDEPTKGIDAGFKEELAKLFSLLKNQGVTIVMVSHDVEFCTRYADRCALFFDGKIVSEGSAKSFFDDKCFYTTSANRMSKGIISHAVLDDDIFYALGEKDNAINGEPCAPDLGTTQKNEIDFEKSKAEKDDSKENDSKENNSNKHKAEKLKSEEFKSAQDIVEKKRALRKNKISFFSVFVGAVFAAAFVISQVTFKKTNDALFAFFSIASAFLSGICFFGTKNKSKTEHEKKEKRKIQKHIFLTFAILMIFVPLTIYAGVHLFFDRKYYFISLCIIIETIIAFFVSFESKKPKASELVLISVMCASAVLGRVAFSPFEQFKPIAAIVMITGICFGCEGGFLVGAVSAFLSNFFFSQGPWTPWQMFALGSLGFISGVFFYSGLFKKSKITVCVFGFLTTLFVYGIIMNCASAVMSQAYVNWNILKAYLISGFVFDLIHAFSTFFFLWFGFESVCEKLERVKTKYGIDN